MTDASTRDVAETRAGFIEMIGLVAQAEGMPRISGRIVGLLMFDGRPFSFGELAEALQVSRGSVSSNARSLIERGIIVKVAKPGDRQDYFEIGDDPYRGVLSGVSRRAAKNARDIDAVAASLPPGHAGARARLARYASFYAAVSEAIRAASAKLS